MEFLAPGFILAAIGIWGRESAVSSLFLLNKQKRMEERKEGKGKDCRKGERMKTTSDGKLEVKQQE